MQLREGEGETMKADDYCESEVLKTYVSSCFRQLATKEENEKIDRQFASCVSSMGFLKHCDLESLTPVEQELLAGMPRVAGALVATGVPPVRSWYQPSASIALATRQWQPAFW